MGASQNAGSAHNQWFQELERQRKEIFFNKGMSIWLFSGQPSLRGESGMYLSRRGSSDEKGTQRVSDRDNRLGLRQDILDATSTPAYPAAVFLQRNARLARLGRPPRRTRPKFSGLVEAKG